MNPVEPFVKRILGGADLILVDVGAANGLPLHLTPLEKLATVCYFEPHAEAAEALSKRNTEKGLTGSRVFTEALSDSSGKKTLYVTNTPTGSSLLKPGGHFMSDMDNPAYYYPMREVEIETRTMASVLAEARVPRADGVKIDVQGTEYFVVKGMGPLLDGALCIEMEIGFPGCYLEQPGFSEIDPVMTAAGFSLFDLKVAAGHRKKDGVFDYYAARVFRVPYFSRSLTRRIGEADAVYFRRADLLVAQGDIAAIRRTMVLHCVYGYFVEALDLNDRALAAGLIDIAAHKELSSAIVGWHRRTADMALDSPRIAGVLARLLQLWQRVQGKLFGRRFTWWAN